MAEAVFWIAWGLPTQGRERQALDLLNESRGYLERLAQDRQIERFDIAVLKPQTTELQLRSMDNASRDGLCGRGGRHTAVLSFERPPSSSWK